ncbi:hypothetical protein [uncultured Campylobacter sp.]|uniref:hypothetical protein n=1 Tax=uncultured Campylobacter sp. TaxID=218934 RepID=UPI00262A7E0F|nr:hypothetical protein [uncultured Campylobacter sp.]
MEEIEEKLNNTDEQAEQTEKPEQTQQPKSSDLDKLKSMDLIEIARTTRIDAQNLEYIINKDFEKLANFNVKGYIKILEREFGLDLSDWLSEFESAKASFTPVKKAKVEQVYGQRVSPNKSGSGWLLWLLAMVLIIGAIFYFGLYKSFGEFLGSLLWEQNKTTYSDAPIVNNTQKKLENIGIDVVSHNATDEKFALKSDANAAAVADENLSSLNALDRSIRIERASAKTEENSTDENATQSVPAPSKDIVLNPRGKMWIGIIDLKSGKKREMVINSPYVVASQGDEELLISTGHGMFELGKADGNVTFSERNTQKFHVKDGNITKISADEFLRLNKGKKW